MADVQGDGKRSDVSVPLVYGLSLLSWIGLAGLAGYAGVATVGRVACEVRQGASECVEVREEWNMAMGRTGAGFMLLFAHSPGEGGGLLQRLVGAASKRPREETNKGLGLPDVTDQVIGDLLGAPPAVVSAVGMVRRFSEGERMDAAADVAPAVPLFEIMPLKDRTVKELREIARDHGLSGLARSARKDELVAVLTAFDGKESRR